MEEEEKEKEEVFPVTQRETISPSDYLVLHVTLDFPYFQATIDPS